MNIEGDIYEGKRKKLNRFDNSGPFLQMQGLTPKQIERVKLQNKAFRMAAEGDYSLGEEIGIFPKSDVKE